MPKELRLNKNDPQFAVSEPDPPNEFVRVGWTYSCSLHCKNGAYASAEGAIYDPSDDGARALCCNVWDTLHFRMSQRGGYMAKRGDCDYVITNYEAFRWSGPHGIYERDRDPGGGDHLLEGTR